MGPASKFKKKHHLLKKIYIYIICIIFLFIPGKSLVPEPPNKAQTGGDGGDSDRGVEKRRRGSHLPRLRRKRVANLAYRRGRRGRYRL